MPKRSCAQGTTTARRAARPQYFGQHFDAANCGGTCDNCKNTTATQTFDATQIARELMAMGTGLVAGVVMVVLALLLLLLLVVGQ